MTNPETGTVVFTDQAGGYFVLPWETLEQGRVPAEQTAEVERLIAEQDDTKGHFWQLIFLGSALIGFGAEVIIGYGDTGFGRSRPNPVPPDRQARPFE